MTYFPDLNIVIPMAGEGKRFKEAGYKNPKPFLWLVDKPMIQAVIENLGIKGKYFLITTQGIRTQGTVETVLLLKNQINNENPLLVANCDQLFEAEEGWLDKFYQEDGGILTFSCPEKDTAWSYAKVENNYVTEVAEKIPISDQATVGVYFFKKGSDFVKYAEQMIKKNIRINGEFFTVPVYNEMIKDGKKIVISTVKKMIGLGNPADFEAYVASR